MAVSKCGGCGNTTFELKTKEPTGSQVKINFIQCSSCGVVVGVTDIMAVGSMVATLGKDADEIAKKSDGIAGRLSNLEAALARR